MFNSLFALLKWDFLIALRSRSDWLIVVIFFTIIVSLFPLSMDARSSLLISIAPAAIWIAALLSGLLSLERVFRDDFDNGILEQLMLCAHNIYTIVWTRIFVHWCTTGLPFTLLAPIYGYALGIPPHALTDVMFGLLLGTPTLSALGTLAAALTVSLRQGGMLSALLIIPFYIPLLIFGANATDLVLSGLTANAPFAFLGAMLIITLALVPIAVYGALRVILD